MCGVIILGVKAADTGLVVCEYWYYVVLEPSRGALSSSRLGVVTVEILYYNNLSLCLPLSPSLSLWCPTIYLTRYSEEPVFLIR